MIGPLQVTIDFTGDHISDLAVQINEKLAELNDGLEGEFLRILQLSHSSVSRGNYTEYTALVVFGLEN
ncbi:hypothetical protein ACG907_02715 [Acinetobacter bereziniae]|uniref:hypothetical protein n=1 Tax=Acinetobacter bereziniae TaxID=106648 RepID=UPI003AF88DB7